MFVPLLLLSVVFYCNGQGVGPLSPCSTSDGRAGQCRPLVKCVRFLSEVDDLKRSPCLLRGDSERGVCCPHIVRGTATCELFKYSLMLVFSPRAL